MQSKLVRLAIVAVVALAIAIWIGNARAPKTEVPGVSAAVAGLSEGVNDVKQVRIVGAGDKTIATLARGDGGWTVVEKGYAADVTKVRELLLKLADAKLVEPKTTVKESDPKLGVEDVSAADA